MKKYAAGILSLFLATQAIAAPASPDEAKRILKDAIAIPTVEGRGQVPKLAAYFAQVLHVAGFTDSDVRISPVGETATLVATLQGRNPKLKPIALLGHMDVVAANPADWSRDPFMPIEENGYIYGRGAADNKFDIAMMIAALAELKRSKFQPERSIMLMLSGDEETAMASTEMLANQYRNIELILNGDGGGGLLNEDGKPDYYSIQAGEKSYADIEIAFTSPGGHSSRPDADNAIYRLSAALDRLRNYNFTPQINELTQTSLTIASKQVSGATGAALNRFLRNPQDKEAVATIRADPEYVGQISTTCVPTMASAGHAQNALPQRAAVNINCRIFPGVSIAQVVNELRLVINDPAAKLTVLGSPVASDASPLRKDVMKAVTKAVRARYPGLQIAPSMSPGATDSVYFRANGIPCYGVAGLFMKPSDDFSHGLNERVPVAAIPGALAHWDSLLRDLSK